MTSRYSDLPGLTTLLPLLPMMSASIIRRLFTVHSATGAVVLQLFIAVPQEP